MRGLGLAGCLLSTVLSTGAASARPPVTADSLISAIDKIDPTTTPAASCDEELRTAETANTANLFYGAAVCGAVKRPVDCAFLLIAGQLRFELDGATMPPDIASSTKNKPMATMLPAVRLYGIIFYQLGGLGPDDAYTDPARTRELLAKLDAWRPTFSASHDPGWPVAGPLKPSDFQPQLAQLKARRRADATTCGRQMTNHVYVAMSHELAELKQRNPNGFVGGTPDYARSQQLLKDLQATDPR